MSNPTFALWRCCLTGETKPKPKKKPTDEKKQNGGVEIAHEAKQDDCYVENKDIEYSKADDPTTPNEDRGSHDGVESGYDNSELDSSAAPSEVDAGPMEPSTMTIVQKGSSGGVSSTEIGAGGRLHLKFSLNNNKLSVKISSIQFAPHQKWKNEDLEVSCMLLPVHKQSFRRRATRLGETIVIQIPPRDKTPSSLRFRLYDHKTITKKYLIGQGVVHVEDLKLEAEEVTIMLDMTSPNTYGIDNRYISGIKPAQDSITEDPIPEILLSLEYRGLTRKLVAEVVKTRNLGLWTESKPCDLYVDLTLKDKDRRVLRVCRTSVKRHVIDIENNEMFMFRLNNERMKEVTLIFSVVRVSDVRKKEEVLGSCAFGRDTSGQQQAEHWDNMLKDEARVEYRWHTLYK